MPVTAPRLKSAVSGGKWTSTGTTPSTRCGVAPTRLKLIMLTLSIEPMRARSAAKRRFQTPRLRTIVFVLRLAAVNVRPVETRDAEQVEELRRDPQAMQSLA